MLHCGTFKPACPTVRVLNRWLCYRPICWIFTLKLTNHKNWEYFSHLLQLCNFRLSTHNVAIMYLNPEGKINIIYYYILHRVAEDWYHVGWNKCFYDSSKQITHLFLIYLLAKKEPFTTTDLLFQTFYFKKITN